MIEDRKEARIWNEGIHNKRKGEGRGVEGASGSSECISTFVWCCALLVTYVWHCYVTINSIRAIVVRMRRIGSRAKGLGWQGARV